MDKNGSIDLAVGLSARSKIWKNKKFSWEAIVNLLADAQKTGETFKEFLHASKQDQSKIKDVGGYVGGYLRNGRRKPENVVHRQLVTLDIDFAYMDLWDDFTLLFDNAAVLHATHKHSKDSPRFRLIMPLSREVTPDEYTAISRKIAGTVGIDLFDNTTFESNRLMFWPSHPKDVPYYFEVQEGPFIDADEILDSYADWRDTSLWPTADKKLGEIRSDVKKQEDPEVKRGIVGAFCRTYTISEAILKFLPDTYAPSAIPDRYTYLKGSTVAGLITYEDKFAYSHHGTDPTSGLLCNAFDLVRIHLYGHLDDAGVNGATAPSFKEMETRAREDVKVKKTIASENLTDARYDFKDKLDEQEIEEETRWMQELEVDGKSNYLSTAPNLSLIFANDTRLKGAFKFNEFDGKIYACRSLPWRLIKEEEPIRNVDYAGVRNYVESIYGITGNLKIDDALTLEIEKNKFHPIRDYLSSLEWDGDFRLDTLLIDYFGAEDTLYTREAIRKTLVGAVARVFVPAIKFDLVLTLISTRQGTGKSSFFKALGRRWFSDTFLTVQGKEALEQLQGSWIIEMAELAGLKKAEVESIKHFISKQTDTFRPAYAKTSEVYHRQCVFVATGNQRNFLRDPSGNRRFMPVDVHNKKLVNNKELLAFIADPELVDQVWAEAVHFFKNNEPLYLSKEAEDLAYIEQRNHSEMDERVGIIEAYLDTLLPEGWEDMDTADRIAYLSDPLSPKGTKTRDHVCITEIWCECLSKRKEDMDRYKTREINEILRSLDNWKEAKSTRAFKPYGKQRYYYRD